jgi:hypothetical protein
MVLVTHDSTVARRAQRIGVMKNGRLTFKQKASAKPARTPAGRSRSAGTRPADLSPSAGSGPGLSPSDFDSDPDASFDPDSDPSLDSDASFDPDASLDSDFMPDSDSSPTDSVSFPE